MLWNVTIRSQVAVSHNVQSFVFIVGVAVAAAVVVMGQYVHVVLFEILISSRFYHELKIKLVASAFDRLDSTVCWASPSKWTIIVFGLLFLFVCIRALAFASKKERKITLFSLLYRHERGFFTSVVEIGKQRNKIRAHSLFLSFALQFPVWRSQQQRQHIYHLLELRLNVSRLIIYVLCYHPLQFYYALSIYIIYISTTTSRPNSICSWERLVQTRERRSSKEHRQLWRCKVCHNLSNASKENCNRYLSSKRCLWR